MSAILSESGLKFGALVNPNSRRNRRRMPDLSGLKATGAPVETPASLAETGPALARLAAAEVEVLAISGGDGAVLTALTAILCHKTFERPPILCLLPGGTTNMTAADVGFGKGGLNRAAAVARDGGGRLAERPVLRLDGVEGPDGEIEPHAGMFFGAIAICRAIQFCRKHLHTRGVVGGAASWLTLAPLLLRNLSGDREDGVLAGAPADIRVSTGDEELTGDWSVLMASTLARLALGANPFWGENGRHGVDATFVRAPTDRLARNILPLLFGDKKRPREPGYVSRRADAFEIAYDGEVTLDGELYRARSDRPLRLSNAGDVRFLTG